MVASGVRREAFERAVRANERDLLRYFQRRQLNGADAAESFGELLLTAWKSHARMPADEEQARMWLFGIAHNVLRNARRSLARRSAATARLVEVMATMSAASPSDESSLDVRRAIEALPRDDAELVRLTYWDGLTSDQAASVLGINASTARSRLSSARQRLRAALSIQANPPAEGAR